MSCLSSQSLLLMPLTPDIDNTWPEHHSMTALLTVTLSQVETFHYTVVITQSRNVPASWKMQSSIATIAFAWQSKSISESVSFLHRNDHRSAVSTLKHSIDRTSPSSQNHVPIGILFPSLASHRTFPRDTTTVDAIRNKLLQINGHLANHY